VVQPNHRTPTQTDHIKSCRFDLLNYIEENTVKFPASTG
jgi:hypothetical protein